MWNTVRFKCMGYMGVYEVYGMYEVYGVLKFYFPSILKNKTQKKQIWKWHTLHTLHTLIGEIWQKNALLSVWGVYEMYEKCMV